MRIDKYIDTSHPRIHWQSQHFYIINKPPNWLSVPSRLGRKETRHCVGIWLMEKFGGNIYPCHRLDYPVSGLMLFARTKEGHCAGNSWFENHRVQKTYLAITQKNAESVNFNISQTYQWRSILAKGKKRAYLNEAYGKECLTEVELYKVTETYCYWHLRPITGRPHQIRFELSQHGMPILGDALYGGIGWPGQGIALQLVELDFSQIETSEQWGLPVLCHTHPSNMDNI